MYYDDRWNLRENILCYKKQLGMINYKTPILKHDDKLYYYKE